MKKRLATTLIMLLSLALVIAGCGSNNSSKSDTAKEKEKTEVTSGASKTSYTDPSELKDKYDIVIVGAGGAGMSAALEAKAKGMNPVILEKMPLAGGNTMKASSGMNA
ncbi:FAD-binding protein, partial [Listeria seeligeri]